MKSKVSLGLLARWHARIRATQEAHYIDAADLGRKHIQLGTPVIVLSTIAGTSVLTVFSSSLGGNWIFIGTGLLSLTAAVLAALQTFLNYSSKQTTHLLAATRLSALKKTIEERIATADMESDELPNFVREVRTEWNAITVSAPLLNQKTFERKFDDSLSDDVFAVVAAHENFLSSEDLERK